MGAFSKRSVFGLSQIRIQNAGSNSKANHSDGQARSSASASAGYDGEYKAAKSRF
jgi:hypothetical protein